MDNRIKDGFGNDFCRLLKSDPATAHYPVVLSSANPDLQLMAKNCLADGYLAKPFELEELVALADRFWLDNKFPINIILLVNLQLNTLN